MVIDESKYTLKYNTIEKGAVFNRLSYIKISKVKHIQYDRTRQGKTVTEIDHIVYGLFNCSCGNSKEIRKECSYRI
jgi:hypothetical protein